MGNRDKLIGGYPVEQLRIMSEMERRKVAQEIDTLRRQAREINRQLEVALQRQKEVINALDLLELE